jgi:hypothetical protein
MIFSISYCKILYLTILVACKKNLNQSDGTGCKIITVEGGKEKNWWGG